MDVQTYTERRRKLRENVADGAILLSGNGEASRNYPENVYPFRQDSSFLYFTGLKAANLTLLLLPDGSECLFGRPEHPDDVVWSGPHPTLADHAASAGIGRSDDLAHLAGRLAEIARGGQKVHYLPPYRADRRRQLSDLLGLSAPEVDAGVSRPLMAAVIAQREIKSDAEIAEIEAALTVTARMYAAAFERIEPGLTEAEIAGAIQGVALARDRQQSFAPIVSVRGEVLHNTSYANVMAAGQLLVIDSGAESAFCYASDITRTVPVSGRFTPPQKDIYQVVLNAQTAAIAAASPQISNRELHLLAARAITEGLQQVGLMRGDIDEAVAAGAHALFFPHGLGHMMGLDVHDMEDLGDAVGYAEGDGRSDQFGLCYLRLAKRLRPGFVVTIEPGIYFIPALIERWQAGKRHEAFINYERLAAYHGFGGIRIEDDILITREGCRVLGPSILKNAGDIEAAMA